MGATTDAARAEVLAAREGLVGEVERLEAAGRAAIDIPAKVRRAPAQTAGLAAGAAFLLAGGPQRLFRRAKRAVMGPEADRPKSMLPEEIDRELRKLGDDGERVRRILEREFASYLEDKSKVRRERDLSAVLALLATAGLKPAVTRAGKELAERLFAPDRQGFAEALGRIRDRREFAESHEGTPQETGRREGTAREAGRRNDARVTGG